MFTTKEITDLSGLKPEAVAPILHTLQNKGLLKHTMGDYCKLFHYNEHPRSPEEYTAPAEPTLPASPTVPARPRSRTCGNCRYAQWHRANINQDVLLCHVEPPHNGRPEVRSNDVACHKYWSATKEDKD